MDSLFGIVFKNWIRLLKENKFNISIKQIPFVMFATLISLKNTFYSRYDTKILQGKKYANIKLKDPIFILGHWRSGTTLLHNLITQDRQFNFPKIYQTINPFSLLFLNKKFKKLLYEIGTKKRPMDNIVTGPLSAGEEEFAMAALTLKSPIVGWAFPRRYDYYEQYLDFKNVPPEEISIWKNEYLNYLKKISLNDSRRLILKSPENTARIKILLEMFPNAKFISIHRNPLNVYKSTERLHATAIAKSNLQNSYKYNVHKRILNTYKKVYEAFLRDTDSIPKGNFIDISFEDLEKNPIKQIEKIYSDLGIQGFDEMKKNLIKYLDTIKGYEKNNHSKITENIKEDIISEWGKYFKYWDYDLSKMPKEVVQEN